VDTSDNAPGFSYNRSMPADSEKMALDLLPMLFTRIAEARGRLDGPYVQIVDDRSSLRLDDRYLGTWRGGGLHVSAMQASIDALMTVQTILESVVTGEGKLPMAALYPVIRTAMECAALAIYLLESPGRDDRIQRSYWVAVEDAKYQDSFGLSMNLANPGLCERAKSEIRTLITSRPSLGEPAAFRFKSIRYSDLVLNADAAMAADPSTPPVKRMSLLAWWKLLSGLSHGKQWAFIAGLERSNAIVDEQNETAFVLQTSSIATVALALQLAVKTLEMGLRLFGQRSKKTWAQPEDASEPAFQSWKELHKR
jgi:hypothetical protein